MRSSVTSKVLFLGLVTGLASVYGCSSGGGGGNVFGSAGNSGGSAGSGSAGASSSAGAPGTAGASAGAPGSAGAAVSTAGAGGGASTAGATGTDGGAGTDGAASGTAGASTGTGGTSGPLGDITAVVKTAGCGTDPGIMANKTTEFMIATSGTKPTDCADSKCGAWSYTRNYYITLPVGYDNTKAYPLVLEGPGCGGGGADVYPLSINGQNNANNTVIRVGLTPPPNAIGHATNPNQGCFDDKEGDSSVDWVFYENLYDHLSTTLCFDRNRVFSAGNSSGAWFSNELGCKYAGDAMRPVRGIMPNTGGLPNQPMYEPTCTNAPMAGMWAGETMDPENPFTGNEFAITRAMTVNHCTQTNFNAAIYANFPIGGGNADNVCKQIQNCPTLYPLVVCLIAGNQHAGHDNIVNPGFSTFLEMFQKAPFLTP
jgi:poly(3-hydroxybutyrate) depolymerase